MTYGCPIDNFVTNSMIVHAESETPTGTYLLAPIRSKERNRGLSAPEGGDVSGTTLDPVRLEPALLTLDSCIEHLSTSLACFWIISQTTV